MRLRLPDALLLAVVLLSLSAWLSDSWAQEKMPRVGRFAIEADDADREWYAPFHRALRNQGWIEGRNISFAYAVRGDTSQYAEAAAELIRLKPEVILADSAPAVRATYAVTRTIPIVAIDFTTDPVAEGYAQSYGRPGGNVTGVFLDAPEFAGKWLELLKAMVPGLSRVAVLWDPSPGEAHVRALQAIAPSLGVKLQILEVRNPEDIDVVASAFRERPQALIILPSPMMYTHSARLAGLAMKQRLPATSMASQFAEAGGLLSYGPELASVYERCGALVGRILSGARAAELPVERPRKFELVVNLKAARALNLKIPGSVLARADKVIR